MSKISVVLSFVAITFRPVPLSPVPGINSSSISYHSIVNLAVE